MKIILEHIRERTIPHDLVEFMQEVPFYEGCMIVQIHDHKSLAPSQEKSRANTSVGKAVPFSIHNYNVYLTPSPYVPFTQPNVGSTKKKETDSDDVKVKSMEQKDKENMPAPSLPNDGKRNVPTTKKVYSVVLRPTPLSDHIDLVSKAGEARAGGRRESRQDAPLSATVPATPSSAVPPTPHTSVPLPAKRVKKSKLDNSEFYGAEAQILLATTGKHLTVNPY
jgi:transcription factor SPT20